MVITLGHLLIQNLQLITNWLLSTYYYLYNIKMIGNFTEHDIYHMTNM